RRPLRSQQGRDGRPHPAAVRGGRRPLRAAGHGHALRLFRSARQYRPPGPGARATRQSRTVARSHGAPWLRELPDGVVALHVPAGAGTGGPPRCTDPLNGPVRAGAGGQPIFLKVLVLPSFSILPPDLRNAARSSSSCSRVRVAFCLLERPDLRRTVLLLLFLGGAITCHLGW